jgi:hypothetical protein
MIPETMDACRQSKSFVPTHQAQLELAGCFAEMFLEHRQAKISLSQVTFTKQPRTHTLTRTHIHTKDLTL